MSVYFSHIAQKKRNNGYLSNGSKRATLQSVTHFLLFLGRPITPTAVSDLIAETRIRHKNDDFTTENQLLAFVGTAPTISNSIYGARVKGIFKANRTNLECSFNTSFTHSTRKISPGVLKALYHSLSQELQDLIDLQAYAGERITCIASAVTFDTWEDSGDYTIIHIEPHETKARNRHICIIPKPLADRIRGRAAAAGRNHPFPNYSSLWRQITNTALDKFGALITSHYLRKRFHTIAGKTPMPVNSWDYLMGDKQSHGHNAGTYTLEDFGELVAEYDRYLAPYLSIGQPKEPDDSREPIKDDDELEVAQKKIAELTEQVLKLTAVLTDKLTR